MTAKTLRALAYFLEEVNQASREQGVIIGAYGCPAHIRLPDDTVLCVEWNAQDNEYTVSPVNS